MSSLDLIGRVAARRLRESIEPKQGRAFFCVVGLEPAVVTAIARHVAKETSPGGQVEVFVHPALEKGDLGAAVVSDKTAPWHRNHANPKMRLTVCTVAPDQVKATEPTLAHNSKIDDSWLLQDPVVWAQEGLHQCSNELQGAFGKALEGLLQAGVAHDAVTIANFVTAAEHQLIKEGLAPEKAVRAALPALRLPRGAGDPAAKTTESAATAAQFFRRVVEETQPALYLKGKDGDPLNRSDLARRLKDLDAEGKLEPATVEAISNLLGDRFVYDGSWTGTQQVVADLGWESIEPFFSDAKRKAKPAFGAETRDFFDNQFPKALKDKDLKLLDDLSKDSLKPNEQIDDFFYEQRARLQSNPKLYKRWERLVFRAPIEANDLTEGLLKLAHRAMPENEESDEAGVERTLIIRLRDAEKLDFWTRDKNTLVLRHLRDRYRGLDALLEPDVIFDCGRCWSDDCEPAEEVVSQSRPAVELEFEAFLVPRSDVDAIRAALGGKPHPNRAQMTWRPPPEALGLSLSQDLRHIRPEDATARTRLLTGRVHQNRAARASMAKGIDLAQRTSITDVFGQSDGLLANPAPKEFRVDLTWGEALEEIASQGILTTAQVTALRDAFDAFHAAYGEAIEALLRGAGLGAPELIAQAEAYGALLRAVQVHAPQEICIRKLLAPLTSIGVIAIAGASDAAVVAPWQPLRLAEIAAKAAQLAAALKKVVATTADQGPDIQDFVDDRARALRATFYADIAVLPGDRAQLLAQTQALADCSLVESVANLAHHGISDEPAEKAVAAFDRVGTEYLKLRPHERANFSVVILNADSENLPLAMANGLSRRIEDDPDLRCELVVTDDDPLRLRQVYERQNRRISVEMDASLASEAARNFLSRLRLGILSPESLVREAGAKASDIVLLQDVVARNSQLKWVKVTHDTECPSLASFTPTERSKRRPFRRGNTTSALYLTAPRQPAAGRAYVDALHAVWAREATPESASRVPIQEVEFQSGEVADILRKAHGLANWVMTFDRVADRRLVATDERRIIRYFSVPGSIHNVIVSTEINPQELADCISSDLDVIVPGADKSVLETLRKELFSRAAQLSGGVVMRGAQWGNYAHELLGLVLTQREIGRLLNDTTGENRTGWFFLDDYRDWLDLTGEMADILAVDFHFGDEGPEVRLVVAEAKYGGRDNLTDHRRRSLSQLESTFTALHHRLLGETTLDSAIWRNRIADMVLEHMEPFEHVGGLDQDHWLEGLRAGKIPIRLEGHSVVFSYDLDAVYETMPMLPDEEKPQAQRRQLAQWVFERPVTAKALRDIADDGASALISRPAGWPSASGGSGGSAAPPPSPPAPDREPPAPAPLAAAGPEEETPTETDTYTPADPPAALAEVVTHTGPWSTEIATVLSRLSRAKDEAAAEAWLEKQIIELRSALQTEGMDAPVVGSRLTPNTGLVYVGGRSLTVGWLEKKQTDLLTRYGLDVVRITPMAGQIAVGLRRPSRAILHLADAWLRRTGEPGGGGASAMAPLLGEKEDDGGLCFLPLASGFNEQETAAPHSLISGTTGSGKGILVTNLILDLCALNSPKDLDLYLIDPKRGVDYAWARRLPQLRVGIIDVQEEALALLARLVGDMDERYDAIAAEGCRNIDHFNRKVPAQRRMPRIVIFFDEVANWMQDDEFKSVVDGLINKIATKSRAAGFHLFMIYQRADNQVMTMQLRTNLGNKLILRLGDEGSSRIALGEKGAERLLGKGHLIAKLGTDERIYMQVPYIGDDEVDELAEAVIATWGQAKKTAAE